MKTKNSLANNILWVPDYEVDSKCCTIDPLASCDAEQLLAMEVEDDPFINVSLSNLKRNTDPITGIGKFLQKLQLFAAGFGFMRI